MREAEVTPSCGRSPAAEIWLGQADPRPDGARLEHLSIGSSSEGVSSRRNQPLVGRRYGAAMEHHFDQGQRDADAMMGGVVEYEID
jgi:hypothetical protein